MNVKDQGFFLPDTFSSEEELEDYLSIPSPGVLDAVGQLEGDIVVLGIAGKMGPTLAWQLKRAVQACGNSNRVIGVSRFSDPAVRTRLEERGIETIAADLLEPDTLERLPDAAYMIYLAAQKFGSTGNEARTWAMNVQVSAKAAERYRGCNIVSLSTGNVYPLSPVCRGGSTESDTVDPVGEYAQSCVGRERMFQHFSQKYGSKTALIRLNYAVETRYGILWDIAEKVRAGQPIDLSMGNVNVLWQGDANAYILQALNRTECPPHILNITGPETVSVRRLAQQFADAFGKAPIFIGEESGDALLNDAGKAFRLFGYPRVPLGKIIAWTVDWMEKGLPTLNKPTRFERRDGKF